jgi:hypothetical protein
MQFLYLSFNHCYTSEVGNWLYFINLVRAFSYKLLHNILGFIGIPFYYVDRKK